MVGLGLSLGRGSLEVDDFFPINFFMSLHWDRRMQ